MDSTEVIFFLHSLREPRFFKTLEKETFTNKYISAFYWLVKDFYNKYGDIPLNLQNPSLEQVQEILRVDTKYYKINPDIDDERNKEAFLSNCKTILGHNYDRYNPKALSENMMAWVDWENFQDRFVKASQYMKTADVTPNNYKDVIAKAKQIFNEYSMSDSDEDIPRDYFDPDFHEEEEEVVNTKKTGWDNFDLLCNSKGTGVKQGNLVLLVGAPNIGKTIFLGNIASNIALEGHNVLFISLEMDTQDMKERLSGRIFGMKMDEYATKKSQIRSIIEEWEETMRLRGDNPRGELLVHRMYSPTHIDIDNVVKRTEKEKDIKINFVVLDYFTEMGSALNIKPDGAFNTYMYHKTNAKGLFDKAGEGDYTTISAHQSSNIDSEAADIFLEDLSESKGILHSPDTVLGIIQGTSHKSERRYFIKGLKTRHSKYKDYFVMYNINYEKMTLTEGAIYSPEEYEYNGVTAQISETSDITSTE